MKDTVKVRSIVTEEFEFFLYWDENTGERWWEVLRSDQSLMDQPAADIPGLVELIRGEGEKEA